MSVDMVRIEKLVAALRCLSEPQLASVERIIARFRAEYTAIWRLPSSDIVTDVVLRDLGDALRVHHCFSAAPLMKERFEYAFVETMRMSGRTAELAESRTNRGHDVTSDGVRFSLKTQADKGIREKEIHISKFMELGKGDWTSRTGALDGLRAQFIRHLDGYDRILTLRCLPSGRPFLLRYELVEVPKDLLLAATTGKLRVCRSSKQTPKPGYCDVYRCIDGAQRLAFQLYFDGGTERKLQIKHLLKQLCTVHASWEFETA